MIPCLTLCATFEEKRPVIGPVATGPNRMQKTGRSRSQAVLDITPNPRTGDQDQDRTCPRPIGSPVPDAMVPVRLAVLHRS